MVLWIVSVGAIFNLTVNGMLASVILALKTVGYTEAAIGLLSTAIGVSIIVAMIPNKKMGAISAVMAIINMSTAPLAPLLAGVGLDTIGYRPTMLSFIVLLAIAVVIMAVNKEIRGIPKPGKWESYRAQAR